MVHKDNRGYKIFYLRMMNAKLPFILYVDGIIVIWAIIIMIFILINQTSGWIGTIFYGGTIIIILSILISLIIDYVREQSVTSKVVEDKIVTRKKKEGSYANKP